MFENLESRRHLSVTGYMSGTQLVVTGTSSSEGANVEQPYQSSSPHDVDLTSFSAPGVSESTTRFNNVYSVSVDMGGGDDFLERTGYEVFDLTLPTTLMGGGGTDTVDFSKTVTFLTSVNFSLSAGHSGRTQSVSSFENIIGTGYNDYFQGNASNNNITAGAGKDTVYGGSGNDTIFGDVGNDYLAGDSGADSIDGQGGNDSLVGGSGLDTLYGSAGTDTFYVADGSGGDYAYGGVIATSTAITIVEIF